MPTHEVGIVVCACGQVALPLLGECGALLRLVWAAGGWLICYVLPVVTGIKILFVL